MTTWRKIKKAAQKKGCGFFLSFQSTHYLAESLSWYSRERLKHSWVPASAHKRFMAARSSAEYGSVSSIRLTTSQTSLASAWRKKGTEWLYLQLSSVVAVCWRVYITNHYTPLNCSTFETAQNWFLKIPNGCHPAHTSIKYLTSTDSLWS